MDYVEYKERKARPISDEEGMDPFERTYEALEPFLHGHSTRMEAVEAVWAALGPQLTASEAQQLLDSVLIGRGFQGRARWQEISRKLSEIASEKRGTGAYSG